jgi:hypothetical protein
MCICLLFLTGANFIVYADYHLEKSISKAGDLNNENSPSPVEEETKASKGLSIQEEYLHEHPTMNEWSLLSKLIYLNIHYSEKLEIVHYELLSPPPKA